jgi:hypothetical protein
MSSLHVPRSGRVQAVAPNKRGAHSLSLERLDTFCGKRLQPSAYRRRKNPIQSIGLFS